MATIKIALVASSALLERWNGQGQKNTTKNLCILTEGVGLEEGAEDWLIWYDDDMLVLLVYSEPVKVKSTHFFLQCPCPSVAATAAVMMNAPQAHELR